MVVEKDFKPRYNMSVLVPISDRHDDLEHLFHIHKKILDKRKLTYEFIFVLDGIFPGAEKTLTALQRNFPELVKVIKFNRPSGEAKALAAAFTASMGEIILTLPAYFQIEPNEINKIIDAFADDYDVIFGQRYPRRDNWLNRLQSTIFHGIIKRLTGETFQDISCGVRLIRREVLSRIPLYGDLHRFIPLLAIHKGYKVFEIPLRQAQEDIHLRIYGPGVYLRRILDILTLFFLIKFTQKPLRFFGLLGSGMGTIGLIITCVTVFQRLFEGRSLSERPLFLGGILFLLMGLQIFFIGLVAEIIIFMHMPNEPEYMIEKFIEEDGPKDAPDIGS